MQLQLPINTELELVTAEQLAWSRGRDEPTADDLKEAERLVSCWNKQKPLIRPAIYFQSTT